MILTVRKPLILGDKVHHIHAEAVHTFIQPEAHQIKYFLAKLRALPIQVRLLLAK
ncbi:hypothetical protein D3C71_2044940 [compost metagenome]